MAQGIQEQNQVNHLGPHGPKGFKSQSQVDHLGPSGPRDSRAKPSGSLGPPWAQGIQEPKNPSLWGSNIREPDYLRHWYSGWGNSGSLMLLLQGRAETRKETRKACATEAKWKEKNANADRSLPSRNPMRFSFHLAPRGIFFFFFSFFSLFFFNLFPFFSSVPEGWERPIGKMVIPTQHQKKFFKKNLPSASTHTHTDTHTQTESTDTETHHHTESTDTHRHKEGRRKEEARKGKEQPKKCCWKKI